VRSLPHPRRQNFHVVLAFGALLALAPGAAHAEDAATARARELFQDGVAIETGGDYAGALKKFKEVAAVKKTPQVLFHIALCEEKLGKLAEALEVYNQASAAAGKDPKLAEVKRTVDEAAQGLEKRVPKLKVKRGKGARSASVVVDGQKLETGALLEPLRLNPGKHVITARARGKDNFKAEVELAEGEQRSLVIKLDNFEDGDDDPGDEPDPPPPTPGGERSALPYVIGGAGLVSLGAAGVFYALRSSADSELRDQCIGTLCPSSAHDTWQRAHTMNTLSNVAAGVGIAALGVSAVMLLVGGSSSEAPAKPDASARLLPRLRLEASPTTMGAQLGGTFLPTSPRARRPPRALRRLRGFLRGLHAARLRIRRRPVQLAAGRNERRSGRQRPGRRRPGRGRFSSRRKWRRGRPGRRGRRRRQERGRRPGRHRGSRPERAGRRRGPGRFRRGDAGRKRRQQRRRWPRWRGRTERRRRQRRSRWDRRLRRRQRLGRSWWVRR
jgi:hypothetical protein